MQTKTREQMIQELTAAVIANPSNWDEGFLAKIPKLTDAWLRSEHSDIGYIHVPSYFDQSLDLNRAFS